MTKKKNRGTISPNGGIGMAYEKIAYNNEFNRQNYDAITIRVPKGEKVVWQTAAKSKGLSLTEIIRRAMEDYMQKN